jgi:outer membrane protein assembly factor BamB
MLGLTILAIAQGVRAEFGDLIYQFAPSGPDSDRIPYDGQGFGSQVALSSTHALIGAEGDTYFGSGTGGSWAFDLATGELASAPMAADIAPQDSFAEGVAVSGDKGVVGADSHNNGEGAAYVFDLVTGTQVFKLRATDQADDWEFGQSVAMYDDRVVVGAEGANGGAGAAYLFDLNTGEQLQRFTVDGEEEVGNLTGIWGDIVMAGTDTETAYLFDAISGAVLHKLSVDGADGFAESIAIHDKYAIVGADNVEDSKGAAFLFDTATGALLRTFSAADGEADDEFGKRVAVEGSIVAISAPAADIAKKGAVYIFDALTGYQIGKLVDPGVGDNVEFGSSLSLSEGKLLVGAENGFTELEVSGLTQSGTAYLYNVSTLNLADVNADGEVNAADIDELSAAMRGASTDLIYDINHDESVDNLDLSIWIEALLHTYRGDANLDGEFNSSDMVAVFQAGQYEDTIGANSIWATGDWDADGDFTSGDLVAAFQEGGYELGPRLATRAVPEPMSVLVVLAGWIGVSVRRRHDTACRLLRLHDLSLPTE